MKEELEVAFNNQITREFGAAAVYRQLAIELELRNLPGIAQWLRTHAAEELTHADRLIEHLTDRDNHPMIGDIVSGEVKIDTVADAFALALQHEEAVSDSIRSLYRLAQDLGDIDSRPVIDWFISEQVQEESSIGEILGRVRLVNEDGPGLLRLDAELGERASSQG